MPTNQHTNYFYYFDLGEVIDEAEGVERNKDSVFVYFGLRDLYGKKW